MTLFLGIIEENLAKEILDYLNQIAQLWARPISKVLKPHTIYL
ncbi:hypothetical protein EV11_0926 [Prochlorococcus sp. SS52]|nr:hypothetical protein EV04_0232 [Prochlorococcus marinus str. LG]KGG22047.1 hypothetical protein EV08_0221 [Prochlorococcus marinus str. SS2]KGG24635.1 hypothetical protein EV09_0267 [Prochlorococcus marinus str. SS35]KGG33528.1 hypothetical protein EV10_0737 [Prochlorococcus marinus str. SS51]KGG36235.1 hypothetical protein EV11_0926 [Prochlorococcus sp. SS52]